MRTLVCIVVHVFRDCRNQLISGVELPAIVHLSFHDAPEAFYGTIVGAMGNSGHALCHSGIKDLLMKLF